jgi:hypothetical protein
MVYTVSFVAPAATGLENKTRMRRSGISMKDFAATLQTNVDRPVVDRTGLEGRFDVEYSFAAAPATADAGGNQPTLLVALEEQLGLKLEAKRTEVPVPRDRFGRSSDRELSRADLESRPLHLPVKVQQVVRPTA